MTQAGYVKSVAADAFRTQGRGGRGVQGAQAARGGPRRPGRCTRPTHAYLLLFSNRGKVYRLRGHEIPMKERTAQGHRRRQPAQPRARASGSRRSCTTRDFPDDEFLVFATAQGQVKKTAFSEYDKSPARGVHRASTCATGDEVVRVVADRRPRRRVHGGRYRGMTIRFSEDGRPRDGPRRRGGARDQAARRRPGDLASTSCATTRTCSLVTDTGFGKRVKVERFNRQGRGGQGVRGDPAHRRARLRGRRVHGQPRRRQLMLASHRRRHDPHRGARGLGQGRDATGVRVMNLDEGHSVATAAVVPAEEE